MAGQRVTQRMLSTTAMRGFQTNLARNERVNEQIASGKRINRPSDDPAATAATMRMRGQNRLDTQFLNNIDYAEGRLSTADTALGSIITNVGTVKTLVINAQDPSLPDASRAALAAQIREIRSSVVDSYNATWLGRPIFGGTVQGSAAIAADGTYVGNDAPVTARIAREVTVRTDISGRAAAADTLPALLDNLADNIESGAVDVDGYQDALDAVTTSLIAARADAGARNASVEGTKQRLNVEQLDLRARISDREDIDIPEAAVELQSSQVAYQASLGAAAKVLQTSLLDYLR